MELFKINGLWGIKYKENEFVPPNYKDPKDAVHEWKWFEIDNLNKEKHKKFLPWNKSIKEINQTEKELFNSI